MQNVPWSTSWTRGERKARRELENALISDEDNRSTRFALARLLASKGEWKYAEDLLRGPGVEDRLLADPTTRIATLSALGGELVNLWRARWKMPPNSDSRSTSVQFSRNNIECRLDVSAERMELLHHAQCHLEDALAAPESRDDFAIRAQVLAFYAKIISDSSLSRGGSIVIFRTSVILAYIGRYDESVRYLEYIEGEPPEGCSRILVEVLLYACYAAMGLQTKASRRAAGLQEAFHDDYKHGLMGSIHYVIGCNTSKVDDFSPFMYSDYLESGTMLATYVCAGFSRGEIPWNHLPGWFHMWQELGEHSMRKGDYYLGVLLNMQALLQEEDAETLVRTGEMLWILRDRKRAIELCERAYATNAQHAGAKNRLSAWAPDKWRDTIKKEEDRHAAICEMQRSAKLAEQKAGAMIARRARREKGRVLRAWWCMRAECLSRSRSTNERQGSTAQSASGGSTSSSESSSSGSSDSSSCSGSSTSGSGSYASSSTLTSLTSHRSYNPSAQALSPKNPCHSFPIPSPVAAALAGRVNAKACWRAETESVTSKQHDEPCDAGRSVAAVGVAAGMVRNVMLGTMSDRTLVTPEMRALARFPGQRRAHEANNTRAVYGL